jgi:hypothetical protein
MTRTSRATMFTIPVLVAAYLGGTACSSSNDPSTGAGGTAGDTNGTGGTVGSGGTASSSGGTPSSSGGTTASTGGTPGATGGATAGGGSTGSGGSTSGAFSPACGNTAAGVAIAKGGTCVAADTQLCYKPCGPANVGFKAETCTSGAYVEGACAFPPDGAYSCFKVPTADSAGCPATAPQHGTACTLAACSVPCGAAACDMCGVAAGYLDSKGSPKSGYCVCIAGSAGNKWSCSSASAWPCPGGQGC